MHPKASAVHGIDDAAVQNEADFASVFKTHVEPMLRAHLPENAPAVLLGYNNHRFDDAMLAAHLRRASVELPAQITHSMDVLALLRQSRCIGDAPSLRLADVYCTLFNEPLRDAHNAVADVRATLAVLSHSRVCAHVQNYECVPLSV